MNDLKAFVITGNGLVEGTPDVENEVAAFSKYMFKNGTSMVDIQAKLTKAHNNTTPLLENMVDHETHLSFSSELIAIKEVVSELAVLIFIFTHTTLINHRDSGIQGSDMNGNLKKLQLDMQAIALYPSGVPTNIQEKVAEVLGNASTPEEPAAKQLKTEHIPTAFAPRGKEPRGRGYPSSR